MLSLFATAFWLIFVSELGDKSLFVVILLSARLSPWRVFWGAALAFLVHGVIAVGLGQLLSGLPPWIIRDGSGALFVVFGLLLLFGHSDPAKEAAGDTSGADATARRSALFTAFTLIFLAEWGDVTQVMSAVLVANHVAALGRGRAALSVFGGAMLGLWLGTALAAVVGSRAGRWLPERVVRRIAGVCFLLVAAYTFWRAPGT